MNGSGFQPVEYKVLIAPEEIEETDPEQKRAKAAGLENAGEAKERERMAQIRGRLVAVGGNAFEDWKGQIPQPGDAIYFAKYAGYVIKGEDGLDYRLANDKDISAILSQ